MSVAARVAGWQRRLGGKPGPFGVPHGSGEQPSGTAVQVELLIDGVWVDITPYVLTRDGSGKVSITRGQSNEGGQLEPSSCRFQLNNRDGRFSPRNPVSPYFGKIGRNTPIRVSVPSGNAKSYRFWGEVASWPQRRDSTGTDVWVDLEAAGITRRLGQGQTPLRSTMYRDTTNPARLNIVAYWPCEDGDGSTSIASALTGHPAMVISGDADLAAYSDWVASASLPAMTAGSFAGDVPLYTVTGETSFRTFMRIPDDGLAGTRTIFGLVTSGSTQSWFIQIESDTGLRVQAYDRAGTLVVNQGVGPYPGFFGSENVLQLELVQSGADVNWSITVFEVTLTTVASSLTFGATLVGHTVGSVSQVRLTPDQNAESTVVGHAVLANETQAFAGTGSAMVGYRGENPANRIGRLCAEEMIPFESVTDGFTGNTVALGPQGVDTFLDIVKEAAAADGGILSETTTALGLTYRSRLSLFSRDSALPLSYGGTDLSGDLIPVDDDQRTRNDINLTRKGGSSFRVELESGALSVLPPPAGVGRYDDSVTLNIFRDSELPSHAGWLLLLGTVDEARYPTISVNLARAPFIASTTLKAQALTLRLGDRVTIGGLPADLPPDDISQLAIGFSETIDNFQHMLTFNCTPQSPYRVAFADGSPASRADTDGSTLAADVSGAGTTLSIATAQGPLWTTDAGEMPFDIRMGGEVIRVTAVSGSVSPQSATVTRSINGVVKPHTAGADIRLDQPAVVSL